MKVLSPKDKIKTIRKGDPDFYFKTDMVTQPRAGFEIDPNCSERHRQLLMECIQIGWIKPVAYMKTTEYFWETLAE